MATMVWVGGVVCCLIGGVAVLPSVCEATLAAAGGLAAWAIYREVSGRYDGLAIVMLAMLGPIKHIQDGPSIGVTATVAMVAVQLVAAPVAGLFGKGIADKGPSEMTPRDSASPDV